MSNERLSIIIIAVLGIAFVIGISERLQSPLPQMAPSSTGGMIASLIALGVIGASFMAYFFNRGQDRPTMIRNLLVWGGIILVVALIAGFAFQGGDAPRIGAPV